MLVPTVTAQMESWSHGRRYPVKLNSSVRVRRPPGPPGVNDLPGKSEAFFDQGVQPFDPFLLRRIVGSQRFYRKDILFQPLLGGACKDKVISPSRYGERPAGNIDVPQAGQDASD